MDELEVEPPPVAAPRHLTAVISPFPSPLRFRWDAGRDPFVAVEAIVA
jgi:hypothetical protein